MRRWFKEYSDEQRLLLALPFRHEVWRRQAKPAQKAIRQLQQQLSAHVKVICLNTERINYDDIWLRDTLPLWSIEDTRGTARWQGLQPQFNGWGEVQSAINNDRSLPQRLFAEAITLTDWIGEGGMFSHNGEWLLVGFTSLRKRNPTIPEHVLKDKIRADFSPLRPIFIDACLSADETQGHIDNMALFINDSTLLYSNTDDPSHPDYAACQTLKRQLQTLPDSLRKIALPLPWPQHPSVIERTGITEQPGVLTRDTSLPMLCSYVNVIVVGQLLVLPQYGIAEDRIALTTLTRALPNHSLVTASAREFVLGGGGLHCISHSLPTSLKLSASAGGRVL